MNEFKLGDVVLSENDIREGVKTVATELNKRFDDAVILTVVPGGIFFTADLLRQLTFEIYMDTISCPHTPGDRNNSSEIVYSQNVSILNKDVILVDDAIESGGTMKRLVHHISNNFAVKSVSVATLFVKPGRADVLTEVYSGFSLDNDDLMVGYGLPWEGKLRNMPCVSKREFL